MNIRSILNIGLPLLSAIMVCCESDTEFEDADKYAKIYMPQAVEYPVEVSLQMADTANTLIFGGAYGGPGYPGSDINVSFDVDFSLVERFNEMNGTSYVAMPEGSYELVESLATIPGGGVNTEPLKLKIHTIGAIQADTDYLLPVSINGHEKIDSALQTTYFHISGSFAKIYMPQAVEYPVEVQLQMVDTAQTLLFSGAYDGLGYPGNDIEVSFDIDPSLVESFNALNGTSYAVMPEGSYEMTESLATIPGGGVNTKPLKLKIHTMGAIQPNTDYLLPVTITEISGNIAEISPELQTAYFHISGFLTEFNKSGWEVIDWSSEHLDPPSLATSTIDDDPATIWHTKYGPRDPMPHHITIDMGEMHKIHGLRVIKRLGFVRGNPKTITIDVSSDGENWVGEKTFTSTFDVEDENRFYLDTALEARYFRLTITESFGEPDLEITHFAEVYAF